MPWKVETSLAPKRVQIRVNETHCCFLAQVENELNVASISLDEKWTLAFRQVFHRNVRAQLKMGLVNY